VVLGIWPQVFKALLLYKVKKDGRPSGFLSNELRTEEQAYRYFVKLVLEAEAPEADLL
jgi:hypothetical protein